MVFGLSLNKEVLRYENVYLRVLGGGDGIEGGEWIGFKIRFNKEIGIRM